MKYKLIIILGVFFVSFAAIFVKLSNIEPSVLAMYRLGIGGLLLLPFALKKEKLNRVKSRDLLFIILAGLVISLHYFFWFTSLNYTSVTSSTLIICTEPLIALLFGFLLYREKIQLNQFYMLIIAMIGVSIVAWGDFYLNKEAIIGDLLTIVATVFFVFYLLIGQNVVKKYSFIFYTSLLFICAGLILLTYNLIMGYELIDFSFKTWLNISLIALIPNAGQLIFNYTLRYVRSSLIATSILLEPIFATILALFILKDQVFYNQMIGGYIIIVSVYIYIQLEQIIKKEG